MSKLAWSLLSEHPADVVGAIDDAIIAGIDPEELGRVVAYAAALRITRFHTQNDHGDWDEVHHAFTSANVLHQALQRAPTPESLRGVYHGALRRYLDRFLNVPAARLPEPTAASEGADGADLSELQGCWDQEGRVDDAGTIIYRYLHAGGDSSRAIATLGHALLTEDAEFHWFQTYEAAVRQFHVWPAGAEESALISPARHASWPPTPQRDESCPRWSESPPVWVVARRCSSHPDPVGVVPTPHLQGRAMTRTLVRSAAVDVQAGRTGAGPVSRVRSCSIDRRTKAGSGPDPVKLHTVHVPCQWATTSSPRPGLPPGIPRSRSSTAPAKTAIRALAAVAQHGVAEVFAEHHQLVGEVVRVVHATQRDEQVDHTRRVRAAEAMAPTVSVSRRSQAWSSAACSRLAFEPKRWTIVEAASPTRLASVANDRADGPDP